MARWILLCCFIAPLNCAAMEDTSRTKQLLMLLSEAEDYISVKPSRTIALLRNERDLAQLKPQDQIRWHIANIRASVATSQVKVLESTIEKVLAFNKHPYFEKRLTSILSGMGIWLRKSGYLEAAQLCFLCAQNYTLDNRSLVIILISLAIVSRHLDHIETAISNYRKAQKLASKHDMTGLLGTIENNLGIIALEQNNLVVAEKHFRSAMALNQKISKRSGHIISGINLLQVFLIQNDFLSYQRLYPSISRLAADFSDKNKSAHLFIVHSAFLVRSGTETSPSDKTALSQAFERLQSRKLQDSLMLHFSADLNIEFNPQKKPEPLSLRKTWLENIEQCDWEALKASLFSNKEY